MNDVIINKAAIIERCIKRVKDEYTDHEDEFKNNLTKQDAIILNIQRACEAAIDMAMHMARIRNLGIPQSSREAFVLLEEKKIIPSSLSLKLQAMAGFRNIAIHNYTKLDLEIVKNIIEKELDSFLEFNNLLLKIENRKNEI